jgi:polyketide cyclase/dehydrase/lipid transport protein
MATTSSVSPSDFMALGYGKCGALGCSISGRPSRAESGYSPSMRLNRGRARLVRAVLRAVRYLLPLALLAWALVRGGWSASSLILSGDQQRRLDQGEVIVLDALPPRAGPSAQGGTALAIVRASPERVWSILIDYPGHTRYYPRVTHVEVLEADDRHALLRYEVGIGPFSFGFHMIKHPDPVRHRMDWQLAEGRANSLFRENTGYWQLVEAAGGTLVTYAIAVRTILPAFATSGSVRNSLVDTIRSLRKLAEESDDAPLR